MAIIETVYGEKLNLPGVPKFQLLSTGRGYGTMVRIEDTATPFLAFLSRTFPSEMKRALRHVGFYLRGQVKEGLASGAPGGRRFKKLSEIQQYRLLDEMNKAMSIKKRKYYAHKRMKEKDKPYAGRMISAVTYKKSSDGWSVHIGWIRPKVASLARKLQAGFITPVTPRMRRFYFAAGIPLSAGKTSFYTPPRPVMKPVFDAEKREIGVRIEKRIAAYLKGASGKAATKMMGK